MVFHSMSAITFISFLHHTGSYISIFIINYRFSALSQFIAPGEKSEPIMPMHLVALIIIFSKLHRFIHLHIFNKIAFLCINSNSIFHLSLYPSLWKIIISHSVSGPAFSLCKCPHLYRTYTGHLYLSVTLIIYPIPAILSHIILLT